MKHAITATVFFIVVAFISAPIGVIIFATGYLTGRVR